MGLILSFVSKFTYLDCKKKKNTKQKQNNQAKNLAPSREQDVASFAYKWRLFCFLFCCSQSEDFSEAALVKTCTCSVCLMPDKALPIGRHTVVVCQQNFCVSNWKNAIKNNLPSNPHLLCLPRSVQKDQLLCRAAQLLFLWLLRVLF